MQVEKRARCIVRRPRAFALDPSDVPHFCQAAMKFQEAFKDLRPPISFCDTGILQVGHFFASSPFLISASLGSVTPGKK